MDEKFETEAACLRSEHSFETEELVTAAKLESSERQEALVQEVADELIAAALRQESNVDGYRSELNAQFNSARDREQEARNITEAERNENAAQQQVLSGMSKEVKAKRRQMQALDSEIDDIHMRRLKADSEVVKLRRQKTSLERQMGIQHWYSQHSNLQPISLKSW